MTLRETETSVRFWTKAHDQAELGWLNSRGVRPSERERLFQIYMLASDKLATAIALRDKLRAQQGRHPYMNLVTG